MVIFYPPVISMARPMFCPNFVKVFKICYFNSLNSLHGRSEFLITCWIDSCPIMLSENWTRILTLEIVVYMSCTISSLRVRKYLFWSINTAFLSIRRECYIHVTILSNVLLHELQKLCSARTILIFYYHDCKWQYSTIGIKRNSWEYNPFTWTLEETTIYANKGSATIQKPILKDGKLKNSLLKI